MFVIIEFITGLNTEHDLVCLGIFPAHVVDVIGRHQRDIAAAGKFDKFGVDLFFLGHIVIHQLDEKVFRTEYFQIVIQGFIRTGNIADGKFAGNFTGNAGRKRNDTFVVLSEQLFVAACFVIQTAAPRLTHDLAEVVVAFLIFRQQNEVETFDEIHRRIAILPGGRRNVCLHTDDWSEIFGGEFLVELLRTAHISVIGNGDTGHLHLFRHFDQTGSGTRPVKHTVVGVQVQVDKICHDPIPPLPVSF